MNNRDFSEITSRLAKALSKDYDVVDLDTVMSVISVLEGTTITKEQLEATRLAKYINQLRRRTKIDQLARRAKSLLKRWREMVGIQQPNDVTQSNPITESQTTSIVDNFPHLGHSQPASPAVSAIENVKSNPSNIELLQSSLTGKLGNHSKKQMVVENVENPQAASRSGRSAISKEITKPPTSFSNLITGFSSGNSQYLEPNISQRNSRNSQCAPRDFDSMAVSNSNSEIKYNPASIDSTPIVIDIPDSSSGSNLIISPAPTIAEPIPMLSSSSEVFGTQFKHKKNKKDKKRKDDKTPKTSSTQNQFFKELTDPIGEIKTNAATLEDKYKPSLTTSNISEILSLSNSSMSSIFPNEDALKLFNQQKSDKNVPSTKNPYTNELSFAGKFNKNYSQLNSDHMREDMDMPIHPSRSQTTTSVDFADRARRTPANYMKFASGNDNNINSNDSSSNYPVVQVCINEPPPPQRNQSDQSKLGATENSAPQHSLGHTEPDNTADKKVPKKRGRKKGSRGVDSVIAKETSLSSQMLITSLGGCGKKVKTTKELYAEMQNRKLGIVPTLSSPTMLQSRPASSCSEPSVQSPRTSDGFSATVLGNETTSVLEENKSNGIPDDDSETVTSEEPSRDSATIHKNNKAWVSESKMDANAVSNATVDKQLLELMKDMPSKPSLVDIEMECLKESFPCTCQVIEIIPKTSDDINEDAHQRDSLTSKDEQETTVQADLERTAPIKVDHIVKSEPLESNVALSPPPQPKKSIFDLDFDEDEDPLLTILTETSAIKQEAYDDNIQADVQIKQEVVKSEYADLDDIANQTAMLDNASDSQSHFPLPDLPVYAIEEDPDCKAKDRFNVQTQKITNFHINALHNCYITNINGNWDDTERQNDATLAASHSEDMDVESFVENVEVVPKFGAFASDFIQKDLRHVGFSKNFVKQRRTKNACEGDDDSAVFLGVCRQLPGNDDDQADNEMTQMSSPRQGHIKEEEREDLGQAQCNSEKNNSDNNIDILIYDHSNDAGQNPIDVHDSCPLGNEELLEIVERTNAPVLLNENNRDSSRRSSSCSNSSLKQIQQSINLKLKNQKLLQKESDSNVKRRKRKRKKYLKEMRNSESYKSKRNKRVSLDSNANSSDGEPQLSDFEIEETTADNESTTNSGGSGDGDIQIEKTLNGIDSPRYNRDHDFCDYHEVVTRDLSIPSTGSNHIVLTFKKTNKTYTSASVPSAKAPLTSAPETDVTDDLPKVTDTNAPNSENDNNNVDDETHTNNDKTVGRNGSVGSVPMCNEESAARKPSVVDALLTSVGNRATAKDEVNIIDKRKKAKSKSSRRRLQEQLFFDHEIYALPNGTKADAKSSSCSEQSDVSECDSEAIADKEDWDTTPKRDGKVEIDDSEVEPPSPAEIKSKTPDDDNTQNELSEDNNGLLVSFNNIYESIGTGTGDGGGDAEATTQGILQNHSVQLTEMLPNKNCDDFNTLYLNNNNFNLTKYNHSEVSSLDYREECKNICNKKVSRIHNNQLVDESSGASKRTAELVPHKEFRTGLRAVDEDVHDEQGNNCSRTQQFKEWHQVLQLRSYNDELLTVLPYVVLE